MEFIIINTVAICVALLALRVWQAVDREEDDG
jgi:hypothetical protein